MHETTTDSRTKWVFSDGCHCTIAMNGGEIRAHICTNLVKRMALEHLQVIGEGVIRSGTNEPDQLLSTGRYIFSRILMHPTD